MDVRVVKLTKMFSSSVYAVNGIDLLVNSGEFTVFLGPSGCGKTTTLRMVAGLERQTSGDIYIGERLVNYLPPKDRNVAMVFQRIALYPSMSVYDNIAFPLEVRKMPKAEIDKKVKEVATLVGIQRLLDRNPGQVSGGEAQRAAIARTLVREPDVLLMDEPLSSLDAKLRVQLRAELKRIHQNLPRTTIYVTHDQEEAMTLGDKIVVMERGMVQQVGTPREIFFQPRNRFVAEFVGTPSMNMYEGAVKSEEGRIIFETPEFKQTLPASLSSTLQEKKVERILWGIRPDTIKIIAQNPGPEDVAAKIEVVELLGTRQLVYANVGGARFTILCDSTPTLHAGETIHMHFDHAAIYIFDAESGDTLMNRELSEAESSVPVSPF